jgi:hypothetical protein
MATDPIADIIGDYRAFAAQHRDRLLTRGIDMELFEGRPVQPGFHHIDDGVTQRLVTATGPNPLPR